MNRSKPVCKYGADCKRSKITSPDHFAKYSHSRSHLHFGRGKRSKKFVPKGINSMGRTYDPQAAASFSYYLECLVQSYMAIIDRMIDEGGSHLLLVRVGIYGGDWTDAVNKLLPQIMDEILAKPYRKISGNPPRSSLIEVYIVKFSWTTDPIDFDIHKKSNYARTLIGNSASLAHMLYDAGARSVCTHIAGNAGRLGGSALEFDEVSQRYKVVPGNIKPTQTTQEEDMFSNLLLTMSKGRYDPVMWNKFLATIPSRKWGLRNPHGPTDDCLTWQGLDCSGKTIPNDYYDAFAVHGVRLSCKSRCNGVAIFEIDGKSVTVIFAIGAGPNAGQPGSRRGSSHKGQSRGRGSDESKSPPRLSSSASYQDKKLCEHGDGCYRKDPNHISTYHPGQSRCHVAGCPENHSNHHCRWCRNSDSRHFSNECRKLK